MRTFESMMIHMHVYICMYKQRQIWFIGQAVSSHALHIWFSVDKVGIWKYPNPSTCQSFRKLLANYSQQENSLSSISFVCCHIHNYEAGALVKFSSCLCCTAFLKLGALTCRFNIHIGIGAGPAGPVLARPLFWRFIIKFAPAPITARPLNQKSFLHPWYGYATTWNRSDQNRVKVILYVDGPGSLYITKL